MFGIDQTVLVMIVLAMLAVGGLAYAFLFSRIDTEKRTGDRLDAITGGPKVVKSNGKAQKKMTEAARRKQREAALQTLDDQRGAANQAKNPPLKVRLKQAGMSMTPRGFVIVSVVLGLLGLGGGFLFGLAWYYPPALGLVLGFGLPNFIVNRKRNKRINAFLKEFAGSIDVIVRGIRSGLPLNDCIRIIANDAQEPVKGEFARIVESQQIGLTMAEACDRMAERVPCPETNFFAIVISIQSQAGGNLGEALSNLSGVLRERAKMKDKIAALAMEAKASGYIIAALPFVVAGLVYIASPNYLVPLWTHETGQSVMTFCAVMLFMGTTVMKKMINFDF